MDTIAAPLLIKKGRCKSTTATTSDVAFSIIHFSLKISACKVKEFYYSKQKLPYNCVEFNSFERRNKDVLLCLLPIRRINHPNLSPYLIKCDSGYPIQNGRG